MTVLDVAMIGEPILRTPAKEVSPGDLLGEGTQRFIDDLIATMRDRRGAGLAAPQVFQGLRICAIEVKDNPRYPYKPEIPLTVLVNPILEPLTEERFDNYEGCLSVPNLRGVVPRATEIRVRALDRHGKPIDEVVRGLSAGTYQHECDHLDGKLFVDRVTDPKTLCTWDTFEKYHRADFVEHVTRLVARYGS